jgi:hypothetical protein
MVALLTTIVALLAVSPDASVEDRRVELEGTYRYEEGDFLYPPDCNGRDCAITLVRTDYLRDSVTAFNGRRVRLTGRLINPCHTTNGVTHPLTCLRLGSESAVLVSHWELAPLP